ncbi:glucose 1-dehydrogenase [Alicyclobacillus acidiphilus]|uniref:glucose 1-dehydrogenase n=1 Tax=Alicyclobacillus acidiphilus TaxID=182455 RepID=UPI0012EEB76D|nr:glucose 1-dehydrogenase [Alicyclobacillus acidiphilus]
MVTDNRVVIVTGGAQGIGLGIVKAFSEGGNQVVIADIDEEAALEAVDSLKDSTVPPISIATDVAGETSVRRLVDDVANRFGRIDVIVNNAGISAPRERIEDFSITDWDRVLAVNLRGPFMLTKFAAPWLRKAAGGGCVINLASTRALMSEPNTFPYSASKGGIVALTHALAVSLGPDVRVNAISPGWIEVADWQKSANRQTPVHRPEDLSQHPVGRVGKPSDIASLCLYLSSPEASFITGQNFVVDGGMTVKMIYEPD